MRFNKRVQMAHFVPVVKYEDKHLHFAYTLLQQYKAQIQIFRRDEYMFPDFEDIDNPALSSSFGWK